MSNGSLTSDFPHQVLSSMMVNVGRTVLTRKTPKPVFLQFHLQKNKYSLSVATAAQFLIAILWSECPYAVQQRQFDY